MEIPKRMNFSFISFLRKFLYVYFVEFYALSYYTAKKIGLRLHAAFAKLSVIAAQFYFASHKFVGAHYQCAAYYADDKMWIIQRGRLWL